MLSTTLPEAFITNRTADMTLRAAPISQLWMLWPGETKKTQNKLPILGRNDPMQRPLQDVLLMS